MIPRVSVIMATYNRGRHILPSVRSVLGQSMGDLECLVIGDGVTDDTQLHLTAIDDPRLRWINLDRRSESQAGPNNRGLDEARGDIVAYCGHDDIWAVDHLQRIVERYAAPDQPDCVASGLINYRRDPRVPYRVKGVFHGLKPIDPVYFCPPSAFSHRADLTRSGLRWRPREESPVSLDYDFETRLMGGGARYGSTGSVTVHKFTSNMTYLDYLQPTSDLQVDLLARMSAPDYAREVDAILERARTDGTFMLATPGIDSPRGNRINRSDKVRGLLLPENQRLDRGVSVPQDDWPRAQHWHAMGSNETGLRWCGPNPTPRLLIPVIADEPASIEIDMVALRENGIPEFSLSVNEDPVEYRTSHRLTLNKYLVGALTFVAQLRPDRASVAEFRLDPKLFEGSDPVRTKAFALGEMRLLPTRLFEA